MKRKKNFHHNHNFFYGSKLNFRAPPDISRYSGENILYFQFYPKNGALLLILDMFILVRTENLHHFVFDKGSIENAPHCEWTLIKNTLLSVKEKLILPLNEISLM